MSRYRNSQNRSIEQGIFEWLITETNEVTVCDHNWTNIAAAVGQPSVGHPELIGVGGGGFLGDVEDAGLNIGQSQFVTQMRDGQTWVSLSPLSDLPMVGLCDAERDIVDWTMADYNPRIIWIGHEPVFVERPIALPVLFAPMARYYWGHNDVEDVYPLCGAQNNANILPIAGAFAYYMTLHFGQRPVRYPPVFGWTYRYRNVHAIVHDNADTGTTRSINTGTLVAPASYGYVSAIGTLTGGPLVANWTVQGRHQDINTAATVVNVGLVAPTLINYNPRTKFYLVVHLQAAAAADGQIDVDSIISVCTGGYNV